MVKLPRLYKKLQSNLLVIVIVLIVVVALLVYDYRYAPVGVLSGNVRSQSFSLAWFSRYPTTDCGWIMEMGKLTLPRKICQLQSFSTNHQISFQDLKADRKYLVVPAKAGIRTLFLVRAIKTKSVEAKIEEPRPAYGSVINSQGVPVANALVTVKLQGSSNLGMIAKTDSQGRWSGDLSGFPAGEQIWLAEARYGIKRVVIIRCIRDRGLFPTLRADL